MSAERQFDILIVDDTPANLKLLSKMLSGHGYRVRPVSSGAMALSAAQAEPPSLILLDIRMPDLDGYAVCQRLKADPRTTDTPIIFISALDATLDKVRAFEAGGLDYITKPFQVEEVLARVETHLALRRLQTKLEETNARMERELALAGEVQASFLPREVPDIPGWELTVTLRPSRQTSGDFYDLISLPKGRTGILIADVVDKGAAAALFMAYSCTLFRNYVHEFPEAPEVVLGAVNQRILEDTHADQFVTAFYGIVDPETGRLAYGNAGHCPPVLMRGGDQASEQLGRTGIPLGIFGDRGWTRGIAQLEPGDLLVLYSDGITEARDEAGRFYGEARLLEAVSGALGASAAAIQEAILRDVEDFIEEAPQADDIVLCVLRRALLGAPT